MFKYNYCSKTIIPLHAGIKACAITIFFIQKRFKGICTSCQDSLRTFSFIPVIGFYLVFSAASAMLYSFDWMLSPRLVRTQGTFAPTTMQANSAPANLVQAL